MLHFRPISRVHAMEKKWASACITFVSVRVNNTVNQCYCLTVFVRLKFNIRQRFVYIIDTCTHFCHVHILELFVWAFSCREQIVPIIIVKARMYNFYEEYSRLIQPRISGVKQNFGYSRLGQLPFRVILGSMPPRISGMLNQPSRPSLQVSTWVYEVILGALEEPIF